jgi:hypothetical protein
MTAALRRLAAGAALAACVAVPWFAAGVGAPARAATWVEVGVATNGVRALVDTDTIVSRPGSVQVQQRFVLPPGGTRRIAYVDQQVVYACASGMVKTLESIEHDAAGRVLRREGADRNRPYKVLLATLPSYILDVLC